MPGPLENSNIKKFYQQAPRPFNYVPNDLVDGNPVIPPMMSGLMRIDPNTGNIWISAGNTLVSDWKLITGGGGGGVTSVGVSVPTPANAAFTVSNSPVISSGTITISANGTTSQYVDGTGALQSFPTIPTAQSLQDVINVSNVLTQDNTIIGTGTYLTWSGNTYFDVKPADAGYFRAAVGKYPPSYSELYVEDTHAQILSQGSTIQIVKVDTTNVYIQTPAVAAATAVVGQVLTLGNASTGAVEYTSFSTPILLTTTQNILVNGGTTVLNNFKISVVAGKSYSFKAVILYSIPDITVEVSWGMVSSGPTFGNNKGVATWFSGSSSLIKYFDILSGTTTASADSTLGDNIATIEGVLSNTVSSGDIDLLIGLSTPGPAPSTPIGILPGSTFIYYEV